MTDTSPKAVERLEPYAEYGDRANMCREPNGDYVTYNDYAALSAQLEAANARADALHQAQSYQYIGKDGKSVLARELEDKLEAANARAARARDDALVEAAQEVTKALAMQDAGYHVQLATLMQAIQDLRTQPPPSVEPVTVQVAAGQSAEQRAAKLLLEACEEASPLDDLIQTAMDRAAFTDGTSEWVFNFRAALRAIAGEKP